MDEEPDLVKLRSLPDVALIKGMGRGERFTARQRRCLAELYRRYADGVYAYSKRKYGTILKTSDEAQSFVGNVFVEFRKGAHRFDSRIAKKPEEIPKLIKCWLKKKADWLAMATLVTEENVSARQTEIDLSRVPSPQASRRSPQFLAVLHRMRGILHRMPAKARDVLLTSAGFRDYESEQFNLPEDVQDDLCKKWGIPSRNALSQYRLRQIDLLKDALMQARVA